MDARLRLVVGDGNYFFRLVGQLPRIWRQMLFVASLCVTAIGPHNGVRKGVVHRSKHCKSEAHQNRTVIVDAGANCGNSLKRLQQLFPRLRAPGVEVYLWEANPHVQRAYLGDIEMRDPRVKLYRNAVWIRDEPVTFFLQKRDENKTVDELRHEFPCKPWDRHGNAHGGSSLISESIENAALYKKDANAFNRGVGVRVQGRDFPAWLVSLKLCKERDHDFVIVKIDIEGAEYLVLSRILDLGLECYADKWLVEFHHAKRSKHSATTGVIDRFVGATRRCAKTVVMDQRW